MIAPTIPIDEDKRIEALKEYSILDTLPEKEYDEITFLASQICNTPISLISLIDDKRQWFKSHYGLDATETPKEIAFCAHAINTKDKIFIVNDSRIDDRFFDNPLVTGEPHVIFYAGMPLVTSEGYALGTLCVIDHEPHLLDESQIKALQALASQIGHLFELRKNAKKLETIIYELETQNKGLEKFAAVAAHDIKSPLCSVVMMAELFEVQYAEQIDAEGIELLKMITSSTGKLTQMIDGILQYSRNARLLSENKEELCINKTILDIIQLLDSDHKVRFHLFPDHDVLAYTNKIALERIFINLLTNGIKYNDKTETVMSIYIEDNSEGIKINVVDNGPGISGEDKEKIFEIFETVGKTDRYGEKGNGIGLATVKALVEGLGGTIQLIPNSEQGANFEFTIKK